jgi:hypothetical protein
MGKELFTVMNAIFLKKEDYEYDKKDMSLYMLNQWLSHDPDLCSIINDLNQYCSGMQDKVGYKYLFHKIPKGKRYIKWTKKEKEEDYKEIADKYGCSVEEIKRTVRL